MTRIFIFLAALLFAHPALAQNRHALVVGIDTYTELDDLSRAGADANAMQIALESLGFQVTRLLDPDRRELQIALIDLQSRISPGDQVAVFFAGHGVEDGGRNYLLPADTPALSNRAGLPGAAVALEDLRDMLHLRRPGVVLLFVDACRDNPLPADSEGNRSVGGSRGLARTETPEGTFILYAAAAGQAARDHLGAADSGPNSVFTRVLIRELARPGLSIQEIGQRTGLEVARLAGAAGFSQRPEYMDGILFPFRLRAAAQAEPTPDYTLLPDPCTTALQVWATIQDSENQTALEGFTGLYTAACPAIAALARSKLNQLNASATAVRQRPSQNNHAYREAAHSLQKALIQAGCLRGPSDGLFGPLSSAALARAREVAYGCGGLDSLEAVISTEPVPLGWVKKALATANALADCQAAQRSALCKPSEKAPIRLSGFSCTVYTYGSVVASYFLTTLKNRLSELGCALDGAHQTFATKHSGRHYAASNGAAFNGFAWRPTVFYYDPVNLDLAHAVAASLSELNDIQFFVQEGAGQGVDPNWKSRTIIVHYRDDRS